MSVVLSHTQQSPSLSNLYLLLSALKLESILMLAPSSMILLTCWQKSANRYVKGYPRTYSLEVYPVYSHYLYPHLHVYLHVICMCISDYPPINVTANENQPSSYGFTQVYQRNLWTILDWTSKIPPKMMLSSEITSENKQDVNSFVLNIIIKATGPTFQHYHLLTMLLNKRHNENSTYQSH